MHSPLSARRRRRMTGGLIGAALVTSTALGSIPLAAASAAPETAAPTAATAERDRLPERIFAPDAFWYRRLPANTPKDPRSAEISKHIYDQGVSYYGRPGAPSIAVNTVRYSAPMYMAKAGDPTTSFTFENCQGKSYGDTGLIANHLSNLRIPSYARPAEGTDLEMLVYDASSRRLTETWVTRKNNGTWSACWGGSIPDASKSNGVFPHPFGTTASGLSLAGGTIRPEELRRGRIDHVIGIALPHNAPWPNVSRPANRTDGYNPSGRPAAAEGQMLRIPASVNLDALRLSPTARTIAKAAQEYGVVVWDTAGSISFRAENPIGMTSDPYPELFRGRADWQEMLGDPGRGERGFPLELLEVLPMNYEAPVSSAPAPTPTPTPTPTTPVPGSGVATVRQTAAWLDQTDAQGRRWTGRGDAFDSYKAGTAMVGRDVAGTGDDQLYRSTVYGMTSYRTKVANGTYRVKLYTAEDYFTAPGRRVYSVSAEGATVLKDVDVFARTGGAFRAYEPTFTVTVTDGRLDLGFHAVKDTPSLAAVEVTKL
ncbi:malectin domain-containing carbohydrate-binding protein [Arsenicicoccus bolidensis]|uniref:Malectin n=1 Tax=Arsenicicoccus bolidensis TaxID=229480 RepID=A0ABS9Q1C5_9MICO|nr:malectin domain-containing carbohydrate-binding protein [Arsenicicoccus bolidensis]MCG7321162.1 malectin [Arsenicicoccus bolidensis]